MPANLTPEYLEAEKQFREAATPEDKLQALRHMAAVIPKHKGTEKMRADLKRRISKLTAAMQKAKKSGRRVQLDYVQREGAGQVVLAGAPNSGKSSLLEALTNARPEIAPYPFTTQRPFPGMMPYEDIQIQLVDIPPLAEDATPPWVSNVMRNADGILLVINLADLDVIGQAEALLVQLRNAKLEAVRRDEEDERVGWLRRPSLVAATQADAAGAADRVRQLEAWVGGRFPVAPVSSVSGAGLDDLREKTFRLLRLVRVYSKVPSSPPDLTNPFVLREGSTVLDVARMVHKDFASHLKYAKIWGRDKFDGQRVHKDHAVHDRDVLELHMR